MSVQTLQALTTPTEYPPGKSIVGLGVALPEPVTSICPQEI